MDMQSPGNGREQSLGDLFERLVDEAGNLLHAEVRIAEAKMTRRAQLATAALGLLCAAATLALIALMAVAAAIVVLLGPLVGYFWAVVIVAILTAGASFALFKQGRARLEPVLEPPSMNRFLGDGQ